MREQQVGAAFAHDDAALDQIILAADDIVRLVAGRLCATSVSFTVDSVDAELHCCGLEAIDANRERIGWLPSDA